MKTLRWIAVIGFVGCAALVACGSDDTSSSGTGGSTAGSGGGTAGTGGGAAGTAGTGGGSAGTAGTGGGSAGTAGTGGGTAGTGGGSAGTSGGAGMGGSAGGTADCATAADCGVCCATNNEAEYTKFLTYLIPCVCQAGECDTDCATSYCATPPESPDATCQDCASNSATAGNCATVIGQCLGDAECAPALQCLLSCP